MSNAEELLAVVNADKAMLDILASRAKMFENNRSRMGESDSNIRRAYEICLNAYRNGGCSAGQLQNLEKIKTEMEALAA